VTKAKQSRGLGEVLAPIMAAITLVFAFHERRRSEPTRPLLPRRLPPEEIRGDGEPEATGLKARLARMRVIGPVLRVQQRYSELRGNNLAASVAFQVFVSIFPLMLVIVGIAGIVSHSSDVDVAGRIVGNLGLTGESADAIRNAVEAAEENRNATAPLGLLGLLWSGLGLVNALQYACNQVWQVEERGLKDKAVGLLWLGGAVVLFVATSAVTAVLNWLPGAAAPVGIAVGLTVNLLLWLWTFKVLPNRDLPWAALLPGAAVGAVGMEVLKLVGGIYVPRAVDSSSALYGSLGVVFAVLGWLLVFSRLVLYATVVNVTRWERRVGTVRTTIEVPGGREIQPSDDVSRSGRVDKADLRT
jgi:membrane protein